MRHKHADLAITFRPGHQKAGVAKERFDDDDVYKPSPDGTYSVVTLSTRLT